MIHLWDPFGIIPAMLPESLISFRMYFGKRKKTSISLKSLYSEEGLRSQYIFTHSQPSRVFLI
jgi:hypothetical protein